MFFAVPNLRSAVSGSLVSRTFNSASLDLNFAANKNLIDTITNQSLVTFTRASSGTFIDSSGLMQTATNNVARFDHDPVTSESLGFLIEEARTNSITNSNNMSAVVTGSPGTGPTGWNLQGNNGGWTQQIVGTGSLGALNYIDIRFFGTPSGSTFFVIFQQQNVVSASNGQTWSASVYYQLRDGASNDVVGYPASNLWDAGGNYIGTLPLPDILVPNTTLQRYKQTATVNQVNTSSINWGITFVNTIGAYYDFTLRFAGPQLELGGFTTSFIPTTGSSATRSADVASITGANFSSWYRQDEGTVYGSAQRLVNSADSGRLLSLNDAAGNNVLAVYGDINKYGGLKKVSSGADNFLSGPTVGTLLNNHRVALANNNSQFILATDGTLSTASSVAGTPTVDRLIIGNGPSPAPFNGTIKRISFFGQRLPNATLQAITQ